MMQRQVLRKYAWRIGWSRGLVGTACRWPTDGLEGLGEVRNLQDSELGKKSVLEAWRAVDIANSVMGPESEFTAAALSLHSVATVAAGDFTSASQSLKRFKPFLKPAELQSCMDGLKLLMNEETTEKDIIQVCKESNVGAVELLTSGDSTKIDAEIAALEAALASISKSDFTDSVRTSPLETLRYGRLRLCRATFAPEARSTEENDADVSSALEALDACRVAALEWSSSGHPGKAALGSTFEKVVFQTRLQLFTDQSEGLLAVALALKARLLHVHASQAVSAEGLFRSSMSKLEALSKKKSSCYSRVAVSSLGRVAVDYAKLLDDWEKRSGEAEKLRNAFPPHKYNNTHYLFLFHVEPWWVL